MTDFQFRRSCGRILGAGVRCQWSWKGDTRQDADEAAAEHETESGHIRCSCCRQFLTLQRAALVCSECVGKTRKTLQEVIELYALLPGELGHLASPRLDGFSRPTSDDTHLQDALVLLGPGGQAYATPEPDDDVPRPPYPWGAPGRRLRPRAYTGAEIEVPFGPLPEGRSRHPLPRAAGWELVDLEEWRTTGGGMQLDSDPESVAQTLAQWEDALRSLRHEPAAVLPASIFPVAATALTAYTYLMPRLGWAAEHLEVFPYLLADLRRLRSRLATATSMNERPQRAEVDCFDCGQDTLERAYGQARPCPHPPPARRTMAFGRFYAEQAGSYRQRVLAWREAHICDQGGRTDVWTCRTCRRTYSDKDYRLALVALYDARRAVSA